MISTEGLLDSEKQPFYRCRKCGQLVDMRHSVMFSFTKITSPGPIFNTAVRNGWQRVISIISRPKGDANARIKDLRNPSVSVCECVNLFSRCSQGFQKWIIGSLTEDRKYGRDSPLM
jgi:hypothetical protein